MTLFNGLDDDFPSAIIITLVKRTSVFIIEAARQTGTQQDRQIDCDADVIWAFIVYIFVYVKYKNMQREIQFMESVP